MQQSGIDGKFLCGTLTVIAGEFHVTRTISRIRVRAQANFQNPDTRVTVVLKVKFRVMVTRGHSPTSLVRCEMPFFTAWCLY